MVRALALCLSLVCASIAQALPPAAASTVYLRTDCGTLAAALQPYCFGGTNAWADLDAWLGAHSNDPPGRNPGPTTPLLVDVGEGTFHGSYTCFDNWTNPTLTRGYVTFQGAGRSKSTLYGDVLANTCTEIAFRDLRIEGPLPIGSMLLVSRGSSVWDRIDVVGSWYEEVGCSAVPSNFPPGAPDPTHVWTDSTITTWLTALNLPEQLVNQGFAYFADCDATIFHGGTITLLVPAENPVDPRARFAAVVVGDTGSFVGYGTKIIARSEVSRPQPVNWELGDVGLVGVLADIWPAFDSTSLDAGGDFELYGGEIVVDSTAVPGQNSTAIYAHDGGTAKATGTKYTLTQQSGQIAFRLKGPGRFDAPHLRESESCSGDPWAPTQVPGAMRSLDGQDAFIEPGCNTAGVCGGGAGTEQHFMVYKESCGASNPWFDRTAGHCRTSNPTASQADDDADGVANSADNCICRANPQITPLAFQSVTGGQLDNDLDGYGNRCDADFDNDGDVDTSDSTQMSASMGKLRSASNCGASGAMSCATFDLDDAGLVIGASDLTVSRAEVPAPGPKCASCPLP